MFFFKYASTITYSICSESEIYDAILFLTIITEASKSGVSLVNNHKDTCGLSQIFILIPHS